MNVGLFAIMVGVGIVCGMMMSVALGYKVWDKGGLLGGAVTGFMMYVLTGGFAY